MLPVVGSAFALEGVLLGSGDIGYLRNLSIAAALGGFLPAIWTTYALHLGLGGIWAGLTLFVTIRLAALLHRLRTDRWMLIDAIP
jgi:Na+-driven multidrug efflux pump